LRGYYIGSCQLFNINQLSPVIPCLTLLVSVLVSLPARLDKGLRRGWRHLVLFIFLG
jgi:hypothetical protein